MNKSQWLVIGIVFFLTTGLFALSYNQIFGHNPKAPAAEVDEHAGHDHEMSPDTILGRSISRIAPPLQNRANYWEQAVKDQQDPAEKLHLLHKAAAFWRDSGRMADAYLWYMGEAARLENSEKSLTFAAHLFLNNLRAESSHEIKEWKAHQSKDLFERSLKLNPINDSAHVGLGATYLFGGIGATPMEGILKIREVAERDSNHIYAQMTLGEASVLSGQLDKAADRFQRVVQVQPQNWEALLALGDVYERQGEKKTAASWYKKSIAYIPVQELKVEVENRIKLLSQ